MKEILIFSFALLSVFVIIGIVIKVVLKRPLKKIIDDFLSYFIP